MNLKTRVQMLELKSGGREIHIVKAHPDGPEAAMANYKTPIKDVDEVFIIHTGIERNRN